MNESPYRFLIVEDSATDLELLHRELRQGGIPFESRCTQTREDFVRELATFNPDLVISDFALPRFDGLTALKLCRELRPEIPFIFVSGTIGEETAVDALQLGATDYLLKGRTKRLCRAVERAVGEARARREQARLQAELAHSQKLEAIGRLAGGVAHDFNNLLTVILGFTESACQHLGDQHPQHGTLQHVIHAGKRAASLTRQLLMFSRRDPATPRILNLNHAVAEVEPMLRRLIGEHIVLETRLDAGTGNVRADPGQIEQVIVNLAVNARDAMPKGGTLTIATALREIDAAQARSHPDAKPGRYVVLEVSDTGCGMDAETLTHIFEPFFTTKGPGQGTGLGLSTVYGIVHGAGGFIATRSEIGKGTVMQTHFPRILETEESRRQPRSAQGSPKGTETILVVEDAEPVRRLMVTMLGSFGYRVLAAVDGEDAIGVFQRQTGKVDLLVTDAVMPRMGGIELAARLRATTPGLKVLLTSGYSPQMLEPAPGEMPPLFLHKPFTAAELGARVREALDQKSS